MENLGRLGRFFLHSLKRKYKRRRVVLIMDNAKKLHCQAIKSIGKEQKVLILYTPSSSPSLHPIEYLFEQAKRQIRASHQIHS